MGNWSAKLGCKFYEQLKHETILFEAINSLASSGLRLGWWPSLSWLNWSRFANSLLTTNTIVELALVSRSNCKHGRLLLFLQLLLLLLCLALCGAPTVPRATTETTPPMEGATSFHYLHLLFITFCAPPPPLPPPPNTLDFSLTCWLSQPKTTSWVRKCQSNAATN